MKLSQAACDRLNLGAFLILCFIIAVLFVEISRAWNRERALDVEINKHTTTNSTP